MSIGDLVAANLGEVTFAAEPGQQGYAQLARLAVQQCRYPRAGSAVGAVGEDRDALAF